MNEKDLKAAVRYERKLLKANGQVVDYPPADKQYTLKELQAAVGGYIEIVHLGQDHLMVVNEEGKLQGLPQNRLASELYGADPNWDYIVGDALVCRDEDID